MPRVPGATVLTKWAMHHFARGHTPLRLGACARTKQGDKPPRETDLPEQRESRTTWLMGAGRGAAACAVSLSGPVDRPVAAVYPVPMEKLFQ